MDYAPGVHFESSHHNINLLFLLLFAQLYFVLLSAARRNEKFLAYMDVDADVEDADPADETFSKHLDANRTFQNNQTNAHERDQYVRYSC